MKYTDKNGNEHTIELSIGSVKRLKESEQVDLLDPQQVIEVLCDPVKAIDVLYRVTKDADLMPAGDFGESFDGDAAEEAIAALEAAIVNFTPARRRDGLKQAIQRVNNFIETANQTLASQLKASDLDEMFQKGLDERMQELRQKISGKASGK